MTKQHLLALALACALASPALAQNPPPNRPPPPEKPLDRGPFTPEASRAYNGGGVILEGAPGAPAPEPRPLPPQGVPLPPR
jgi:hypothetical protein